MIERLITIILLLACLAGALHAGFIRHDYGLAILILAFAVKVIIEENK